MVGSPDEAAQPGIRIGFALPRSVFPVYLATWHGRGGRTASVLLLGNLAGDYLLRTLVVEASGACAWDGATPFPSDMDPQAVWDQVEEQLDLIGAVGEWCPDEPTVVDVTGFGAGTETARPVDTASIGSSVTTRQVRRVSRPSIRHASGVAQKSLGSVSAGCATRARVATRRGPQRPDRRLASGGAARAARGARAAR